MAFWKRRGADAPQWNGWSDEIISALLARQRKGIASGLTICDYDIRISAYRLAVTSDEITRVAYGTLPLRISRAAAPLQLPVEVHFVAEPRATDDGWMLGGDWDGNERWATAKRLGVLSFDGKYQDAAGNNTSRLIPQIEARLELGPHDWRHVNACIRMARLNGSPAVWLSVRGAIPRAASLSDIKRGPDDLRCLKIVRFWVDSMLVFDRRAAGRSPALRSAVDLD